MNREMSIELLLLITFKLLAETKNMLDIVGIKYLATDVQKRRTIIRSSPKKSRIRQCRLGLNTRMGASTYFDTSAICLSRHAKKVFVHFNAVLYSLYIAKVRRRMNHGCCQSLLFLTRIKSVKVSS